MTEKEYYYIKSLKDTYTCIKRYQLEVNESVDFFNSFVTFIPSLIRNEMLVYWRNEKIKIDNLLNDFNNSVWGEWGSENVTANFYTWVSDNFTENTSPRTSRDEQSDPNINSKLSKFNTVKVFLIPK